MWKHGGNSELLRLPNTSLCRVIALTECSNTAGLINLFLYTGKVCLCTTNCRLYHKDPCPERGLNHSKVVIRTQNKRYMVSDKSKKRTSKRNDMPNKWNDWHVHLPDAFMFCPTSFAKNAR